MHLPGVWNKVGRSKPPPVLTGGLPRSICQNVVNTGQYESEWSIENFKGLFTGIKTNIFFSVASWAPKVSNSGAQPIS